jgi:3-phenylpropionate/trans-cinnamate dioxygenase ferredoxin subunit
MQAVLLALWYSQIRHISASRCALQEADGVKNRVAVPGRVRIQTFSIYHLRNGFFASDGWCTHERAHLADGLVLGDQIECPMHLGRFDIKTGNPLNPPVCKKLRLHPVKLQEGNVLIGLSAAGQS